LAFKTFTAATLSSSDMNTYLMKQSVIVCTSATRPASPVQGMTIFETDTSLYRFYDATTWVPCAGQLLGTATGPGVQTDCGSPAVTVCTLTVPQISGRKYLVHGYAFGTAITAAAAMANFAVGDGTVTDQRFWSTGTTVVGWGYGGAGALLFTSPSTGNVTYTQTGFSQAGALRVAAGAARLTVVQAA
jgi:hypothetical protein